MMVIGITGSIATGKTFVGSFFKQRGYPVYNADQEGQRLLEQDAAIARTVAEIFPDAVINGAIDRPLLAQIVWNDFKRLEALESVLHPEIRQRLLAYVEQERQRHTAMVFLEVPLLFEKGWERYCTHTIVTHCTESIQQERALQRPGITNERLQTIGMRQMPQSDKQRLADFTIDTGQGNEHTIKALNRLSTLLEKQLG